MMLKIKYSYQSSQVLLSQNPIRYEAEIKQAHLVGERYGQQVFCRLNHFHKHNILTSNMIGQIYRHLESYDLDEAVRIIWLDCQSKGTDLKYLLRISPEERINYLRQIQNLAVYFGQYNKQLLPIIGGEMSGSAASLACTTPFQFFSEKGGIRFNDVNKGFVPHAGATYHLSRLPDELGMYFALTGRWILKDEAIESGLVYGRLHDRDSAIKLIHQNIQQYHYPTTWEMYPSEINKQIQLYTEGYDRFLQQLSEEMINRMKTEDPKLVATELLYKLKRFEEENVIKAKHDQVQQRIANPYLQFKELNIDDFEELNIISRLTKVTLDKPLIARCFSGKSVSEIMERLKSEESPFAQKILAELQAQPQLSLELAFKMIRQAEKQQWRDCLVTEHNVSSNLANSGEMEKQSKIQNVDSFFDSVKPEIDYIPNALEPVKDFYKEYPDNVRYFLNEQNLRKGLRERTNQEIDVGSFMINNQHPIDGTVPVSELRKMRIEIAELKRDLQLNMQKLQSLIGYEENLTKYCQERQSYLDNVKDIDEVFENALTNYFEHAHQARLNSYNDVAKVAVTKLKRKLFSLVRNALLNQRLTSDPNDPTQFEKYQAWLRSMNRLLIFPKDDSLSFFEADLPDYDKIVDKECDEQEIRSREFRGKLFETRYGDPYQDHQKALNQFYGGMVHTVVNSKRFPNITEYLKGREADEIIQELKQNHEEIQIELKKVERSEKTLNVESIKNEISGLQEIEYLDQKLSSMITSNPFLKQEFLQFLKAPRIGLPLNRKFIKMLKAAYNARINKVEKLKGIAIIDDEINNTLIQQSFASIEDNLFFSYSYALLIELEEIFSILKTPGDREISLVKLQEIYGIKRLTAKKELILLKYLDQCLRFATTLYNTYREKALKSEEKVLDYLATLSQDQFKHMAIYRNRLIHKTKENYQRELQTLTGNPEYKYSMDELYSDLEKDQSQINIKKQLMKHMNKKDQEKGQSLFFYGEVREDVFMPNQEEMEVFAKAINIKAQKCRELVVGLHYQLKSMDLIAEKQIVITPTHIQEQKTQLEELLNRKWFSHKKLDEWFKEMAEETIANLYHPEMILSMEEFRKALQIHWDSEKKLLEGLRAELILGIQNEKDTEIQKQKFQPERPEIQDLARQLTVSESFAQQGLMEEPEEMEALFVGHFGQTLKETGFLPPKINEAGYRELRSKMIQRVEHIATEWSKEPKLIDQDEIDQLYEKIQQLQNRDK